MESHSCLVILTFLIAVFLQFIPPQLCKEITGFEMIPKNKDNLVDSKIGVNFDTKLPIEKGMDHNVPIKRIQEPDVIRENITCVQNLCENVPNYPLEKIQNAIRNISSRLLRSVQRDLIKIEKRQSSFEETMLCDVTQSTMYPEKALNTNNQKKYIINIPELQQGVVIRTCVSNNIVCKAKKDGPPFGYISKCAQTYSHIRLLSFETENGPEKLQPKYDTFSFPSGCECSIK